MISLSEESTPILHPRFRVLLGSVYLLGALPGQLQGQAPGNSPSLLVLAPPSSRAPGTGEPSRIYDAVLYTVSTLGSLSTDPSLMQRHRALPYSPVAPNWKENVQSKKT